MYSFILYKGEAKYHAPLAETETILWQIVYSQPVIWETRVRPWHSAMSKKRNVNFTCK